MKLSLGSRVEVEVTTDKQDGKDGESLFLFLDFHTPWGVVRNVSSVHSETMRAIIVWLRSNYGSFAYDFVAANTSSINGLVESKGK